MADLTVPAEDENSVIGGLMWFTWLLAWAVAAATGAIGIALGLMRLATRHPTPTA